MPRRRIIDPQFWNDAQMGRLPVAIRLFYIGLWNFSDDAGIVSNDPSWLRVSIFPHDARVKPSTIVGYLEQLEATGDPGRLLRYAVGSREYFLVTRFHDHQSIEKPTGSRLPRPPQALLEVLSEKARRAVMARTVVVEKSAVAGRAQNGIAIGEGSPSGRGPLTDASGRSRAEVKGSEGNRNERAPARIDEIEIPREGTAAKAAGATGALHHVGAAAERIVGAARASR